MKQLLVWILQTGEPLHIDPGNPRPMRAMNLANALIAAGHKVVIFSSSFNHQDKRHRVQGSERMNVTPTLQIRLIASPGYDRNIGPSRMWDHAVMARNLVKELESETNPPDVAFIGYPPIETATVMTRWCATHDVPCMLDVKDQWPAIFLNALPASLRSLGHIVFAPYFYYGRRAMREATALSAMADGFLQWAADFAGRSVNSLDRVFPLTMPTGQVSQIALADAGRWWDQQGVEADGTHRICFIGSHSPAFDIDPVCQAAFSMASAGNPCQFVFCGDGADSIKWREKMAGLSTVYFPGWVDRAKVEALALRSSAALAPYHNSEDFVLSIPNKVIDSLAFGLPVLSPLHGEVRRLISDSGVGISYGTVSGISLEQCIKDLTVTSSLRRELSANALRLYRERFSYETVYGGLVKHLVELGRRRETK